MELRHKEVIRRQSIYLLDHLTIDVKFLTCLYRDRILSDDQLDELTEVKTSHKRINLFCALIRRRGPKAFQGFIDALIETEQEFIATKLFEDLVTLAETSNEQTSLNEDEAGSKSLAPPATPKEVTSAYRKLQDDPKLLCQLLQSCLHANNYQEDGATLSPLQVAVDKSQSDLVSLLLELGCDIHICDSEGQSLLHRTARTGDMKMMKVLLQAGVDVNITTTKNHRTALHVAIMAGQTEAAAYLIENSPINTHAPDKQSRNALYIASQFGDADSVKLLLSRGASMTIKSNTGRTALHEACYGGHAEIVNILLEALGGANVVATDDDGRTNPDGAHKLDGIMTASDPRQTTGKTNRSHKTGCGKNLPVDNDGRTPLHWACLGGHMDIASILLYCGADVNAGDNDGDTPLHVTCRWGLTKVAKLLLELGANVGALDKYMRTPLHEACIPGHAEVAELLTEHDADVNTVAKDGRTPLHVACIQGNKDVCLLLLEHGTNVNVRDKDSRTPLHGASIRGHIDVVKLLVKRGAQVNSRDSGGRTSLHEACIGGQVDIVRLLIQCGGIISIITNNGTTPLHFACTLGHADVSRLLVKCGADPKALDEDGITPIDLAMKGNNIDIVYILTCPGTSTGTSV